MVINTLCNPNLCWRCTSLSRTLHHSEGCDLCDVKWLVKYKGGWRMSNGHLHHIKDMHEVHGIQPCPFNNHVCCRDVAARPRCIHLIHSNDWKTILNENLTDHWKLTGSPQTLPLTQHSLQHQNACSAFHHIPNTMD